MLLFTFESNSVPSLLASCPWSLAVRSRQDDARQSASGVKVKNSVFVQSFQHIGEKVDGEKEAE